MADKLTRYSLPPEQYAALRATQVAEAKALGTVDEIRFEGLERTNPEVLRALVESKPGEPLTEEKVGADLRRIYGTRDYESISYRIVGGDTGPRAMVIEPKEKSWGGDYLRFGLALASDFQGDNAFNVLVQYRKTWLNRLGGEWLTEAQIGQNTHLSTEFYQPLNEAGQWFVAPTACVGQQTRGVFVGDGQGRRLPDQRRAGWRRCRREPRNLGPGARRAPCGRRSTRGSIRARPVLPSVRETTAGLRGGDLRRPDRPRLLPDRRATALLGTAYAAMTSFGSALNYQRLEGAARGIRSWGPHTLNVAASGGTALGVGHAGLRVVHARRAAAACRATASTSSPAASSRSAG